jgi:hypothetical protein
MTIEPAITAAIITGVFNLISAGLVALIVSLHLIKYQARLEEEQKKRLAFKEPSHSKILFDSQNLIKYTQRAYVDFLTYYFYTPYDYFNHLIISNESSEEEIEEKIHDLLLSKNEKRIKSNFVELRNQGFTTFYAFYHSVTNGFIHLKSLDSERQYYLENDEVPLPHPDIKRLSGKIYNKIIVSMFSQEFKDLVEFFKDPNVKFIDHMNRFKRFWIRKTKEFMYDYQELENLYHAIWNIKPDNDQGDS